MTGKKFERTTPEAVGISSKSLERLIENLEQVTEMHGIVVMRHEKICAEGWWAPYAPGIRHSLHSLSKTYSATAVGIAVTEGKVSLDEKILSIFSEKAPENPDEYLKQLTVKDILCMGSGMERLPEVQRTGCRHIWKFLLSIVQELRFNTTVWGPLFFAPS